MAAPAFAAAGSGVAINGTSGVVVSGDAGGSVGDFVILHILQDGWSISSTLTVNTFVNIEALDGTDSSMTQIVSTSIGDAAADGLHRIYLGRLTGASHSATVTSNGFDLYCRFYRFTGVNTGTTSASVFENGTAGLYAATNAQSDTIDDADVTTLGADRLALQFVACGDDNALDAFTGMSGGTWAEATAEFASATGTDGAIGLQIATKDSAGTISGGSDTMAASDPWGVIGFALIPPSASAFSLIWQPPSVRFRL